MGAIMNKMDYAVEMRGITKNFGTLTANDKIDLFVKRGSVHAIIGENGAGKSTLMNILSCVHLPDMGEISIDGKKVTLRNSLDAVKHVIGMVHQEFMLYPELSVYDNIIYGFEERKLGVFIDKKACVNKINQIMTSYNLSVPLDSLIKDLPVSILQQVEILKVLYRGANIIIMDEPTSVLTPQGIQGLFNAIRFLVNAGKTIIFISHKLKEVLEIADTISVLKDGKLVKTLPAAQTNEFELASLMVGRDVILKANKRELKAGEILLKVENLRVKDKDKVERVKDISFEVRAGEIVGIAGVAGSGQQQLVEAIFGLRAPEAGSKITFDQKDVTKLGPREHRMMGMGYVPQDRIGSGINSKGSVWETAIMGYHIAHGFKSKILLNFKQIETFTNKIVKTFDVKRQKNSDSIRSLSGGNIQKLVVGREFLQDNRFLVIEDPTRGIDVGAIEFIWDKIIDIASNGVGILLISHELNEVMQLSDRILAMYNGQIFEAGNYGELTEEEIGLLMLGGHADEAF